MNLKSTLNRFALTLLLCTGFFSYSPVSAQYCYPTFSNGCSSWATSNVTFNSLNWFPTGLCTDFDFTTTTINATTGVPHYMTVTNGSWCGCAVWIDYNNDYTFDVSENQFYAYVAGTGGTNTYNIYITIPNGTPIGTYRMRVISPWGSDGLTTANGNGNGPCGAYMYGNFQDFSLVVTGPQGMEDLSGKNEPFMIATMNAEASQISVLLNSSNPKDATLQLMDISGRVIESRKARNEKEIMDVSQLSSGLYILNYFDGEHRQSVRLSK